MIHQTLATKLIKIYDYICKKYESSLKFHCERFSNNCRPEFTDEEVLTIYLFTVYEEKKRLLKRFIDMPKIIY